MKKTIVLTVANVREIVDEITSCADTIKKKYGVILRPDGGKVSATEAKLKFLLTVPATSIKTVATTSKNDDVKNGLADIGTKVKFNGRGVGQVTGIIVSNKRVNYIVEVDGQRWKVKHKSASLA